MGWNDRMGFTEDEQWENYIDSVYLGWNDRMGFTEDEQWENYIDSVYSQADALRDERRTVIIDRDPGDETDQED